MLAKIIPPPGVSKVNTDYENGGRWKDGDKYRFVAGLPEKLGGWSKQTASPAAYTGIARGAVAWRDNAGNKRLGFGTNSKLYVNYGGVTTDITPFRTGTTSTLSGPLTTSSSSATVTVAHTAHGQQTGDWVVLTQGTALNGITLAGVFQITVTDANTYTVTAANAASASSSGGGTVTYVYFRKVLGSNPFATTSGSASVTVTDTAHGASNGDTAVLSNRVLALGNNPFATTNGGTTVTVTDTAHGQATGNSVTFSGAAAVAGLTLTGPYTLTKIDANTYTVPVAGANATTTGGGAAVIATYTTVQNGITFSGSYVVANVTSNTYTITAANNANASSSVGATAVTARYEITVGQVDNVEAFGYGVGTYNTKGSSILAPNDGYGVARSTSVTLFARVWTLVAYGQQLIGCPFGGGIFTWDPTAQGVGNRALPLYGAPSMVNSIFLTDERFLIALGTAGNPSGNNMTMQWPDQNDTTAWASTATNTANSGRKVVGGNYLVGGVPLRGGLNLLVTDSDAFTHQYVGDNFVFDTHRVGSGCGLVGPQAITEFGGVAYWFSDRDLWMYDGFARPLPTDDIRDFVFKNLNFQQRSKTVAATNKGWREVWFLYASNASSEIDSYVIFHVDQLCFSTGSLVRTAWVDKGIFQYPIGFDASGFIYNHESGTDNDTAAMDSSIILAPTNVSNLVPAQRSTVLEDRIYDVMGLVPDTKRQSGNISLTLLTRLYPQDADTASPTYSLPSGTQRQDTREAGKMIGLELESNVLGGDWRWGALQVDIQPGSQRE